MKATYVLEGDGALAFRAFEEISKLKAVISTAYYPNVVAVANKLSSGRPVREQQLIDYVCNLHTNILKISLEMTSNQLLQPSSVPSTLILPVLMNSNPLLLILMIFKYFPSSLVL